MQMQSTAQRSGTDQRTAPGCDLMNSMMDGQSNAVMQMKAAAWGWNICREGAAHSAPLISGMPCRWCQRRSALAHA